MKCLGDQSEDKLIDALFQSHVGYSALLLTGLHITQNIDTQIMQNTEPVCYVELANMIILLRSSLQSIDCQSSYVSCTRHICCYALPCHCPQYLLPCTALSLSPVFVAMHCLVTVPSICCHALPCHCPQYLLPCTALSLSPVFVAI